MHKFSQSFCRKNEYLATYLFGISIVFVYIAVETKLKCYVKDLYQI